MTAASMREGGYFVLQTTLALQRKVRLSREEAIEFRFTEPADFALVILAGDRKGFRGASVEIDPTSVLERIHGQLL